MSKRSLILALLAIAVMPIPAYLMGTPPSSTPDIVPMAADNVQEVRISAKQFEYAPNNIEVQKNLPVRLIITSQDVTHGFAIDELKINAKIEKGKDTVVNFTPDKAGTYVFYCSVFCGFGHHGMQGKLVVK